MLTLNDRSRRPRRSARVLAALTAASAIGITSATPASADAVALESRRYVVTFHQIQAVEETGPTNFGLSDEIYAGFETTVGGQKIRAQVGMFGDFDAGETRLARANQSCLAPIIDVVDTNRTIRRSSFEGDTWGCALGGVNAPFSIRARLFESDFENGLCIICTFEPSPLFPDPEMHRIGEDDDPVGETTLSFSRSGLANDLASPGSSRDYTVVHRGSGGHYKVTYRVTRIA